MRECFPQGKMPGTAYYYRCNNAEVVKKLKKFFVQENMKMKRYLNLQRDL